MTLEYLWQAGIYFALFFGGVLLIATAIKIFEIWRVRHWLAVDGRVVSARVVSRSVGHARHTSGKRTGNFAEITYEYIAGGRSLRAKRVNVTPPVPDSMVEETLAKYPEGSTVTVFYNPANPADAVLEREWPRGLALGVLFLFGFIGLVAYGIPWLLTGLEEELAKVAKSPGRAGGGIALTAVGIFVLMMGTALRRQSLAAMKWPAIMGKITSSTVESVNKYKKGSRIPTRSYRPKVVYSYEVNDRRYSSDRLSFGGKSSGSIRRLNRTRPLGENAVPPWVEAVIRRYPTGAEVAVYYDSKNPSEAVLERGTTGIHPLQWISALIFAAAAGIAFL